MGRVCKAFAAKIIEKVALKQVVNYMIRRLLALERLFPGKGQVTIRYCGVRPNAHRRKVKMASSVPVALMAADKSGEYEQR